MSKLHIADARFAVLEPEEEQSLAMQELYQPILSTEQYKRFQEWDKSENQLFCISGSVGQGKTMLLTTIVQTLHRLGKTPGRSGTVCTAFFFFDYGRFESNNATAALKNLIWHMIAQQPSLSSSLKEKFSSTGREYFGSPNDFLAFSAVFYDMVQNEELSETYLVVDALDECLSEKEFAKDYIRNQLLELSTTTTTSQAHSKLTQLCLHYRENTPRNKSRTTQDPLLDWETSDSPSKKSNLPSLDDAFVQDIKGYREN